MLQLLRFLLAGLTQVTGSGGIDSESMKCDFLADSHTNKASFGLRSMPLASVFYQQGFSHWTSRRSKSFELVLAKTDRAQLHWQSNKHARRHVVGLGAV